MGIYNRISRAVASITNDGTPAMSDAWSARQVYQMLEAYYMSNGVYNALAKMATADIEWAKSMLEIKNPTYAVVELYAKKVWPGTLPDGLQIQTDNPEIIDPIHQVWKWSNWCAKKTLAARYAALYGDMFMRVTTPRDAAGNVNRVSFQLVNPRNVTDFDLDERGYITYLRYDVPTSTRDASGQKYTTWHTEVWTPTEYSRYNTPNAGTSTGSIPTLGKPVEIIELATLGIDFVPWVHAPFMDVTDIEPGDQRGMAAIWPAISKIDYLHKNVTRLGSLLFRHGKPQWGVFANTMDSSGRPMAPPKLETKTIDCESDSILYFPGLSSMESLIPNINYEAHAAYIADLYDALKIDLPEIRYYEAMQTSSESGRALQIKLGPIADRVLEVRGLLESALIRADQMALHIGVKSGLFPESIGAYADGAYDHTFRDRTVFVETETDKAERVEVYTRSGVPVTTALVEFAGWTQEKANAVLNDIAAEATVKNSVTPAALPAGTSENVRVNAVLTQKALLETEQPDAIEDALNAVGDIEGDAIGALMAKYNGANVRA